MSEITIARNVDFFADYRTVSETGAVRYAAGFPSYPANFSRDTFIAGILSGHDELLYSQLCRSAENQGACTDPTTGERPGKIHHEIPGAQLAGRPGLTTYNACDTTALFLISAEGLRRAHDGRYAEFMGKHEASIRSAVRFMLDQIDVTEGLSWERVAPGAERHTLRVTYWKDSILPHAGGKKQEPVYPVVYALAHFINARGLLAGSRLLNEPELAEQADKMFRAGIGQFMGAGDFTVYRDQEGLLRQVSSDELHALAYIPAEYENKLPLAVIAERARELATPYGYLCTPQPVGESLTDRYHGDTVWVFEQAMMHYGAAKFGLEEEAMVARRIEPYINDGQELYGYEGGSLVPRGNSRQLWSVAAAVYFRDHSALAGDNWL